MIMRSNTGRMSKISLSLVQQLLLKVAVKNSHKDLQVTFKCFLCLLHKRIVCIRSLGRFLERT